jgi:hypothetical protein
MSGKKGRGQQLRPQSSAQWWQVLLPVQITYTASERYRYERLFKHVQADTEHEAIAIAQRMLSRTQTLIDSPKAWPRSAEAMELATKAT